MAQQLFLTAFAEDRNIPIDTAKRFIDFKINKHIIDYCRRQRYTSQEIKEALQLVDRETVYETGILTNSSASYHFDFIQRYFLK